MSDFSCLGHTLEGFDWPDFCHCAINRIFAQKVEIISVFFLLFFFLLKLGLDHSSMNILITMIRT